MNIQETQAGFPDYVNDRFDRYKYIPGQGFVKPYQSRLFDVENGHDYLNGQGYLGYNITRHVGMQFGYGKHFIGNGYCSLLLSDFSNNFLYLKINWKVWKFHYQNIFAELTAGTHKSVPGGTLVNKNTWQPITSVFGCCQIWSWVSMKQLFLAGRTTLSSSISTR